MSVTNGQPGDQDTFNNAFLSKTDDTTAAGKVGVNNTDPVSGTQVTNVQREHNSVASYVGKALNSLKDILPSWVSTGVGTPTDNLTERAEALTAQTGTNTGDIATNTTNIATNAADILLREETANKGQANGYAELDGTGRVPSSQLTLEAFEYKGTYDANTNTPTLINGTGNTGDVYHVAVAGTQDFGAGNITFAVGDKVVYDGAVWEKWDLTDAVVSVNSLTGAVVLNTNDINDIDTTGVATGDYLRKSATDWVDFDPDQIADDAATGANATLSAITDKAVIRLTSGTLVSIDMIPAEARARRFVLVNDTGVALTVNNLTGATPADQIITGTGANIPLADQASLFLVYDLTETKWRVVGGSGAGGGDAWGDPVDANIVPDANNTRDLGNIFTNFRIIYSRLFLGNVGTPTFGSDFNTGLNAVVESGLSNGAGGTGDFLVHSGDQLAGGTGTVGKVTVKSGDIVEATNTNDTGDVIIGTGTTAGAGARGTILLQDGSEGTSGHVWTSTGTLGEGEWQAATGGGDAWSDPVDSDIIPSGSSFDLGNNSNRFSQVHANQMRLTDGTFKGLIRASTTGLPSGDSTGIYFNARENLTLGLYTIDNAAADAVSTGGVNIESGNKTAGTGDSGDVTLYVGTSAGGARGDIVLKDGSEGTVGHVWTSTGTGGEGEWQAAAGGGGDAWSDPVDANIVPDGDGTRNLGSAATRMNFGYFKNLFVGPSSGSGVSLIGSATTPTTSIAGCAAVRGESSSTALAMFTNSAAASESIYIETGAGATTVSGDINLETGTANTTRGQISMKASAIAHNQTVSNDVVWENGVTGSRPGSPVTGQRYFDTTIGLPIWYDGTNWIDAAGTTV